MKDNDYISLSFEWHSLLRDVIYNFWTVVLAFLIGLLGVYIAQRTFYTPTYKSSSTFCVKVKNSENSSLIDLPQCQEMTKILTTVLTQPTVKENATKFSGLSFNGSTLSASQIQNTNFITLSVVSDSPKKAYDLLCSVILTYNDISDEVFDNAVLKMLTSPSISSVPINSISNSRRTLVALGCAFADLAAIIFLSMIRDTVKSRTDFSKEIASTLIGSVPHEKKTRNIKDIFIKNKTGLLINESLFTSIGFNESYHQIAGRLKYIHKQSGDKVFAITSVAENEGKSTACSNIALSLASNGYKVLVLDLDFKKPALFKMFKKDFENAKEFSDVVSGEIPIENYELHKYRKTSVFFAANTKPHPNQQQYLEKKNIDKIVSYYRNSFDFIFIDTAPMVFDANVTNIIPVVDKTILVIRTDVTDIASINDAIKTIENTGGSLAGCILNDVYPEFSLFGQVGSTENGSHYRYGGYNKYGKYWKYGKYNKYSSYGKYASSETIDEEINDNGGVTDEQ